MRVADAGSTAMYKAVGAVKDTCDLHELIR